MDMLFLFVGSGECWGSEHLQIDDNWMWNASATVVRDGPITLHCVLIEPCGLSVFTSEAPFSGPLSRDPTCPMTPLLLTQGAPMPHFLRKKMDNPQFLVNIFCIWYIFLFSEDIWNEPLQPFNRPLQFHGTRFFSFYVSLKYSNICSVLLLLLLL